MRDRLPSGSTTNNNGTPRRVRPLITARRHPWKGCRLRVITTEVGRSWEWVVCGVFVREHSACRAFEVGSAPDRRSACAASDQDVAGLPRGRNRRSRTEDTHDRGAGQAARHPAGLAHLTLAGEHLHAPVRAGMEDVRARANPRRAVEKIHALTGRSCTWQETTTLVGKVNRTLRGWANYFSVGAFSKAYRAL